jgi:hypothetical protein
MIKGHKIICFGSEKWQYPGLQQTIMRFLSQGNKIIYVNSLGTRKVSLRFSQFGYYLKQILRRFSNNNSKNKSATNNVIVCNPWIIPLVYSDTITKFNRILIRRQFAGLLPMLDFRRYILWLGTPTAAFLQDLFDPELLLYNPVDRYYAFPFVDREKLRYYEHEIVRRTDVNICTSDAIRNDLLPYNEHSFTVSHGVDFEHFNSALHNDNIPEDIKNIAKPIIGYFGGLSTRVNFRLISRIAEAYPQANIVLIGRKLTDLTELTKYNNVNIIDYKNFGELPLYLKEFTVCMIPYHVNELMEGVDPIKLREYLCTGKPVISVNLPEVRKFEKLVYIGLNEDDFVNKVGDALEEKSLSLIEERISVAKKSDWAFKIDEISEIIENAIIRKKRLKG